MENINTLSTRLKTSRKEKGLTQQELEKKSGVSQQLISGIENGKIESTNQIFNLAEALNITAKWLATGTGEKEITPPRKCKNKELSEEAIEFAKKWQNLTPEQKALLEQTANILTNTNQTPTTKAA